MKHSLLAALFITAYLGAFGVSAANELSSNIMRRVNTANQSLDKVAEMIESGKADLTGSELKNAQQEYDNIHQYYGGTFDPKNPTLVKLKGRIDELTAKAQGAQEAPAKAKALAPAAKIEAKGEPAAAPATAQQSSPSKELSSNIRRRMKTIEGQLKTVEKLTAKGQDASVSIATARQEFKNIHDYYKGSFDPNDPELVALEARIDAAEKAMRSAVAAKDKATAVESRMEITGMPGQMGEHLMEVGRDLLNMEQRLDTAYKGNSPGTYYTGAKNDLDYAEKKLAEFNDRYAGKYDPEHEAYVQVTQRIENGRLAVAKLKQAGEAAQAATDQAAQKKYAADVERIMSKYQNQAPTSKIHAANVGRMVWADKMVGFKDQDRIETRDTFRLTDPIFARVYLPQSLGNTPVYDADGKPSENYEYRYEFRLFIDGQEMVDKFGVFSESKLNGEAGETWTTWQIALNPVPFDNDFQKEAEAWRRVTRLLTPGKHNVRLELWGSQGQFKSREPLSVGEFALHVAKGDRVAAAASFPSDSHNGGDVQALRGAMTTALVGPVAKTPDEVLQVSVTSDWKEGIYRDTKKRYRSVSGAVLWQDTDGDGVCRFVTYNFVSDHLGGSDWTPVKFKSFCLSCPEGDTECPK